MAVVLGFDNSWFNPNWTRQWYVVFGWRESILVLRMKSFSGAAVSDAEKVEDLKSGVVEISNRPVPALPGTSPSTRAGDEVRRVCRMIDDSVTSPASRPWARWVYSANALDSVSKALSKALSRMDFTNGDMEGISLNENSTSVHVGF